MFGRKWGRGEPWWGKRLKLIREDFREKFDARLASDEDGAPNLRIDCDLLLEVHRRMVSEIVDRHFRQTTSRTACRADEERPQPGHGGLQEVVVAFASSFLLLLPLTDPVT